MRVRFFIPGSLRSLSGGQSLVDVDPAGGTVQDAVEGLFAVHHGLRDRLLTEKRELRPHVNLFVGDREVRSLGGFATPLADGVEISILPAISGG